MIAGGDEVFLPYLNPFAPNTRILPTCFYAAVSDNPAGRGFHITISIAIGVAPLVVVEDFCS